MKEHVPQGGVAVEAAEGVTLAGTESGKVSLPVPEDGCRTAGAPGVEESHAQGADPYFVGGGEADQVFSGNPIRFALHAVFYCAGKVADKIVSLYSKTFKLDREYVADYNRSTGMAHAERGDWGKAIPMLEKALAMASDDLETRMCLARAYSALEQHEKACAHLTEVLKADPESIQALRVLGSLHSRRQDYEQATECLERAVNLAPDHAQSFYRLAAAYDNRKLYDAAIRSFKDAIRLDPRFAKAYQALGFTYESMGDRDAAVGCFKKALELD